MESIFKKDRDTLHPNVIWIQVKHDKERVTNPRNSSSQHILLMNTECSPWSTANHFFALSFDHLLRKVLWVDLDFKTSCVVIKSWNSWSGFTCLKGLMTKFLPRIQPKVTLWVQWYVLLVDLYFSISFLGRTLLSFCNTWLIVPTKLSILHLPSIGTYLHLFAKNTCNWFLKCHCSKSI